MKAILMLNEMPKSCNKCVLKRHWFNYKGTMKVGCKLRGDCGIDYKRNERAVWCPLIEINDNIAHLIEVAR